MKKRNSGDNFHMHELDSRAGTIDQCEVCAHLPRERVIEGLSALARILGAHSESQPAIKAILNALKKVDCENPDRLTDVQKVLRIVARMIANDIKVWCEEQGVRQTREEENMRLRSAVADRFRPENIIGNSPSMRLVYERIRQVAPSNTTVLIRGESGTGKELVASAIHYNGSRSKKPFVKVNCAVLSETLIESELFGHKKGAFTGALQDQIGRIEEAEGGTLFLDEIGEFSPSIQGCFCGLFRRRNSSVSGAIVFKKPTCG